MLTSHTLRRVFMRNIISLAFVARPCELFGTLSLEISVHHDVFVTVFLEEKNEEWEGRGTYV
jgi:hypothetical protein